MPSREKSGPNAISAGSFGPGARGILKGGEEVRIALPPPRRNDLKAYRMAAWLDDRGFVVEDGVIFRTAADDYLLTCAEPNLAYFAGLIGRHRVAIDDVSEALGRRLKILVGKPGLDGHSNGAEQIAVRARDIGMDVVYEGIRLTPSQIAASALQEGVHVVGLSILSGSHRELIPSVVEALRDESDQDLLAIGQVGEGRGPALDPDCRVRRDGARGRACASMRPCRRCPRRRRVRR